MAEEREHLIEWLVTVTGYSRQYFDKMTDSEIKKLFESKINRHPK